MTVVSVIVPAFNCAATIGATLEALAGQDLDEPFEVIVVDDGSADGTVAIAEESGGRTSVIRQDHLGPGPARNRGAAAATSPALAFTDADCTPAPDWLRAGLKGLRGADLVQGAVLPDPEASRRPLDHTITVTRETGLYESANLFITRELFERLGGFEDWLGPVAGKPLAEDVWLGWRARRSGAGVSFDGEALVHHAVSRRSLASFLKHRWRLVYFPRIAAKIPEIRGAFFRRRLLTRRSAGFDLAVVAVVAAIVLTSLLPLLLALPYAWLLARESAGWRRYAPQAALATLLGDAVGFAALVYGSLRARSLVL